MATLTGIRDLLREADRVLVLAGAGMSAELAVPTYWTGPNAKYASTVSQHGYTELEHADAGLWHTDSAAQQMFYTSRYAHLLTLDPTVPTSPYAMLLNFLHAHDQTYFVATSNVDSFFVRSGFESANLYEVHGTYRESQCLQQPQAHGIFPTPTSGVATCPTCGSAARPNVMFFNDYAYNPTHMYEQKMAFDNFRETMTAHWDVVIEVGAGNTIPTIRNHSIIMSNRYNMPVIRINPNLVQGVDGIAQMIPKSKTAPFVHIKQPATAAFALLFSEPA